MKYCYEIFVQMEHYSHLLELVNTPKFVREFADILVETGLAIKVEIYLKGTFVYRAYAPKENK